MLGGVFPDWSVLRNTLSENEKRLRGCNKKLFCIAWTFCFRLNYGSPLIVVETQISVLIDSNSPHVNAKWKRALWRVGWVRLKLVTSVISHVSGEDGCYGANLSLPCLASDTNGRTENGTMSAREARVLLAIFQWLKGQPPSQGFPSSCPRKQGRIKPGHDRDLLRSWLV